MFAIDLQAGTPAPPVQNDVGDENGDDEPPLNENDDEDLDDIDQAEELNTQHLVLAQFDKVFTASKSSSVWSCTLILFQHVSIYSSNLLMHFLGDPYQEPMEVHP